MILVFLLIDQNAFFAHLTSFSYDFKSRVSFHLPVEAIFMTSILFILLKFEDLELIFFICSYCHLMKLGRIIFLSCVELLRKFLFELWCTEIEYTQLFKKHKLIILLKMK